MAFKQIQAKDISENTIRLFDDDWGLLCAGTKDDCNGMTVSWGAIGKLWEKDVCFSFVRPQRYTKKFMDEQDHFTLCFFDETYRKALAFCGSKSGRDYDKFTETGFTPYFTDNTVGVEQAKVILICKKLAWQDIDPKGFTDSEIDTKNYPHKDYHRMYIGEIVKVLIHE